MKFIDESFLGVVEEQKDVSKKWEDVSVAKHKKIGWSIW